MTRFKNTGIWILSVIITLLAAYFQKLTGPSYPVSGKITLDSNDFSYTLKRSFVTPNALPVKLETPESTTGTVFWKRYPTSDPFTGIPMEREGITLTASIPAQPPAGKVQYYIELNHVDRRFRIPSGTVLVTARFRGDVPASILIPHILIIFGAMLVSNRAAFAVLYREKNVNKLTFITLSLMTIGGFVLGCMVQYHAFGVAWSGFPLGHDLTDNKVLFAEIAWLIPVVMILRKRDPRKWVFIAALVTLIVFMIPHSLLGSQLEY